MTAMTLKNIEVEGFAAIQVETGAIALTLIPALGGKVSSLRDLRSGREWLWRQPRMAYRQVAHGASYTAEADTGGWDECFPTVAPCVYPLAPWQGAVLQDHGELWSQTAAQTVEESDERVVLHTRWTGVALPYAFERTMTLTAGSSTVRVDYVVSNPTSDDLRFIWCIHPLLAIEPGMRLLTPPSARFNCWASVPPDATSANTGLPFPLSLRDGERLVDLDPLPEPTGVAVKLWSDPLDEGWTTLQAQNGSLTMRWDVAVLPQVAFWLNLGAWAGDGGTPYYNLGLEPCIGAQDSLADAISEHNLFATAPAKGSYNWWLEISLS